MSQIEVTGRENMLRTSEIGRTDDWTDADWSPDIVHANRSFINMSHRVLRLHLVHLTVAHLQMHLT